MSISSVLGTNVSTNRPSREVMLGRETDSDRGEQQQQQHQFQRPASPLSTPAVSAEASTSQHPAKSPDIQAPYSETPLPATSSHSSRHIPSFSSISVPPFPLAAERRLEGPTATTLAASSTAQQPHVDHLREMTMSPASAQQERSLNIKKKRGLLDLMQPRLQSQTPLSAPHAPPVVRPLSTSNLIPNRAHTPLSDGETGRHIGGLKGPLPRIASLNEYYLMHDRQRDRDHDREQERNRDLKEQETERDRNLKKREQQARFGAQIIENEAERSSWDQQQQLRPEEGPNESSNSSFHNYARNVSPFGPTPLDMNAAAHARHFTQEENPFLSSSKSAPVSQEEPLPRVFPPGHHPKSALLPSTSTMVGPKTVTGNGTVHETEYNTGVAPNADQPSLPPIDRLAIPSRIMRPPKQQNAPTHPSNIQSQAMSPIHTTTAPSHAQDVQSFTRPSSPSTSAGSVSQPHQPQQLPHAPSHISIHMLRDGRDSPLSSGTTPVNSHPNGTGGAYSSSANGGDDATVKGEIGRVFVGIGSGIGADSGSSATGTGSPFIGRRGATPSSFAPNDESRRLGPMSVPNTTISRKRKAAENEADFVTGTPSSTAIESKTNMLQRHYDEDGDAGFSYPRAPVPMTVVPSSGMAGPGNLPSGPMPAHPQDHNHGHYHHHHHHRHHHHHHRHDDSGGIDSGRVSPAPVALTHLPHPHNESHMLPHHLHPHIHHHHPNAHMHLHPHPHIHANPHPYHVHEDAHAHQHLLAHLHQPQLPPQPSAPAVPTRKYSTRVNVSSVLRSVSHIPRAHLGSIVYDTHTEPITMSSNTLSSGEQYGYKTTPVPIPRFTDKANCTFTVRVPRWRLDSMHRQEACARRALWGSGVYTDDSDPIAAAIHGGWIRGSWGADVDIDLLDLEITDDKKFLDDDLETTIKTIDDKSTATAKDAEQEAKDGSDEALSSTHKNYPPLPPSRKDLHIHIIILPSLVTYASTVRYGIKSRSWGEPHTAPHDGMSYMIREIEWVDEVGSSGMEKGGSARKKRMAQMMQAGTIWTPLLQNV